MRDGAVCSDMFRNSLDFITLKKEKNIPTDNDGVFACDETVWGNHLLRLVADHAELAGLRVNLKTETIYKSVFEKLRYDRL